MKSSEVCAWRESGVRRSVLCCAFGRNLASVAVKTRFTFNLFGKIFNKRRHFNMICKDNAAIIFFSVQKNRSIPVKFRVFWDVAPCSHVEVDRRLRGAYCLHHQGDHRPGDRGSTHLWKRRSTSTWLQGATSQKTLYFILAAVRTWNLTGPFPLTLTAID
jgi:hypothetical protein